jgi:hypothetical protein
MANLSVQRRDESSESRDEMRSDNAYIRVLLPVSIRHLIAFNANHFKSMT